MTALSLLFTMAALGLSETAYLIRKRRAMEAPVCPIGEDCHAVLSSKYSRLFFVHNEIAGFVFYAAVSVFAALLVIGIGPARTIILILSILVFSGSAASLFFLYLQWKVIKAWCFWCVMSALTIFAMAVIILSVGFELIP
ncbi:MAG: vitamin K epoxide reductase family protein [Candidatus Niyogibacteria bacterium]|nr:vitamin K epoxide reductase family protein [Candidatus Niyogibacteria bacterium]